jgi:large subunit ribosomal protein L14
MIQTESILVVADNSGAKSLLCIKVLGGSKKRYGRVGDLIVGAVQDASPTGAIKKKSVVRAIIIRTKKQVRRDDGTYVSSDDNACVIVDDKKDPKGTRIFGPVFRELKNMDLQKIVSLAAEVV